MRKGTTCFLAVAVLCAMFGFAMSGCNSEPLNGNFSKEASEEEVLAMIEDLDVFLAGDVAGDSSESGYSYGLKLKTDMYFSMEMVTSTDEKEETEFMSIDVDSDYVLARSAEGTSGGGSYSAATVDGTKKSKDEYSLYQQGGNVYTDNGTNKKIYAENAGLPFDMSGLLGYSVESTIGNLFGGIDADLQTGTKIDIDDSSSLQKVKVALDKEVFTDELTETLGALIGTSLAETFVEAVEVDSCSVYFAWDRKTHVFDCFYARISLEIDEFEMERTINDRNYQFCFSMQLLYNLDCDSVRNAKIPEAPSDLGSYT